jgi:cyclopropane fatty-acyl-phospholipid synthase-like methyltransferase
MTPDEATKSGYWEQYYSEHSHDKPQPPSQFAAFVIQEVQPIALAIDIGCGSGRDTFFFARHGVRAMGIDGSHVVIDSCSASVTRQGISNLSFECVAVESSDLKRVLDRSLDGLEGIAVAYARFFLHAITEDEQRQLLDTVCSALRQGDVFAAEFRTTRDAPLSKVTAQHYRRYVDPSLLINEMAGRGFATTYMVEGFGYAKYKSDDAYIARLLFRKDRA